MKIGIVGGGASGVYLALLLKQYNENIEVLIIEHNDGLLKKLAITGSGKCNFANLKIRSIDYSNYNTIQNILDSYLPFEIADQLLKFGIPHIAKNNLLYPKSESAKTVVDRLLFLLAKYNVKLLTNCSVSEYVTCDEQVNGQDVEVFLTNGTSIIVDHLVFATGGITYPKTGSDGSLFELLKRHSYNFSELKVGLAPVQTKEKLNVLDGDRLKCNVKLYFDQKFVYEEYGEVLFKKNGLGGIVIYNMCSLIARNKKYENAQIELEIIDNDLLSKLEIKEISDIQGFLTPKMYKYLCSLNFTNDKLRKILSSFTLTYLKPYGPEFSQVTVGGIKLEYVNEALMSKHEHNVYFVGEMLDVDGLCGGYNLMWSFCSSFAVYNDIISRYELY